MTLFDFHEYRSVVKWQIKVNESVRGYQTLLARAAGCQRAFLSQALNSHVQLTPDHVAGLSKFWQFDELETDYFLELVLLERASSPNLKQVIERRLRALKKQRLDLAERLKINEALPEKIQAIYYSSWHMAAIHVLLSIPEFNDIHKISQRLHLSPATVQSSIKILEDLKVVKKTNRGWTISNKHLYLPKASPFTGTNHINWRQRAIENIQSQDTEALHYSVVSALSISDIEKFRELILKCIEDTRKVVEPSPEEETICFTCDLFKV